MRPISMADIARALADCDPKGLAAALAVAGSESVARATEALEVATDLVASFPRDEVIAEADALLFDVLRWPLSDVVPGWEQRVTAESYAVRQGVTPNQARLALERLRRTERDAARALLAAGPIANYTLEQSQVVNCIETLLAQGQAPTRDLVRALAFDAARRSMRPEDGDAPLVYSTDEDLAPRIVSPSPKVHAVLWLQRMQAQPAPPHLLDDRLTYLRRAAHAIGTGAMAHARMMNLHTRPPHLSDAMPSSAEPELPAAISLVS